MISSLVARNTGSLDDAKDIFQDTMIVLYNKSIDPDFTLNCQLSTFIYSVSKKLLIKKLQIQNRILINDSDGDIEVEDTVGSTVAEDHLEWEKKYDIMNLALSKLGEPCKSLLEAFYINKKPMTQIATQFNYTNADNAKTQKYKCLMRLKKIFFTEFSK
jgi:RNA polymerase sigma factor (sigma-70 family)